MSETITYKSMRRDWLTLHRGEIMYEIDREPSADVETHWFELFLGIAIKEAFLSQSAIEPASPGVVIDSLKAGIFLDERNLRAIHDYLMAIKFEDMSQLANGTGSIQQ